MLSRPSVVPVAHEFARSGCLGCAGSEFSAVRPEWPSAIRPTGSLSAEIGPEVVEPERAEGAAAAGEVGTGVVDDASVTAPLPELELPHAPALAATSTASVTTATERPSWHRRAIAPALGERGRRWLIAADVGATKAGSARAMQRLHHRHPSETTVLLRHLKSCHPPSAARCCSVQNSHEG